LLRHKSAFLTDNDAFQENVRRLSALYAGQQLRHECMNCNAPIGNQSFEMNGISYSTYKQCGRLNGMNEDANAFCEEVYSESGSEDYALIYATSDRAAYFSGVDDIYTL
jgi:hypothetical protein